MCRLRNLIGILVSVAIFIPYPSWEHFIWPLSNCVLADICNHTWIPECAINNDTMHRRLFIDDCDMWEFNCDYSKNYILVNYSSCFEYNEYSCPTFPVSFQRRGNYKYILEGRKMVYAPTSPNYLPQTHYHSTFFFPATTRPNLPSIMFHGKRRYTPEAEKKKKMLRHTHSMKRKPTTPKLSTQKRTMVLKKHTVIKNGIMMMKIIKGVAPETTKDSDFVQ